MNPTKERFQTGYLGTYFSPESAGIYQFSLNLETGGLTAPRLYYRAADAKYLSLCGKYLTAPKKEPDKAGVCLLDVSGEEAVLLSEDWRGAQTACFVLLDGDFLYTANYHEGTVLIYRTVGETLLLRREIRIAPEAGCHQVLLFGRFLLVPCLLLDKIMIFDREQDFAPAGFLSFPKGSGPRHGVFSKDRRFLFVISELSNELFSFQVTAASETSTADARSSAAPNFRLLSASSLFLRNFADPESQKNLPDKTPFASAAIRLAPDGRHLYVSTRFADMLTVFAVHEGEARMIQQTESGGVHPRDIAIAGNGRFLLAANRKRGGLVCFRLDPETGRIGSECSRVPAPEAVSIALEEPFSRETANIALNETFSPKGVL